MSEIKYCPYCGHKYRKDQVFENDEEYISVKCGRCKRELTWGVD